MGMIVGETVFFASSNVTYSRVDQQHTKIILSIRKEEGGGVGFREQAVDKNKD